MLDIHLGRSIVRVVIAGATGVLGRRLVRQLRSRGHEVVGLVRRPEGEEIVRSLGGEARRADLFDAEALARAAGRADVVIHAATAIPTGTKFDPAEWTANDRIRREGTQALTRAAATLGASLYLQQSIVWVAQPADGSPFDEDSPAHPEGVMRSALDGEQIARDAGARHGFAVGVLRCGGFYAADAEHTRTLGRGLARRKIPIVGRGDAVMGLIHADDAAGAFVAATEAGHGGLWHIVDDEPAPVAALLTELARHIGAPTPRHVPVWLARLFVGEHVVRQFTASVRTSNARFRREVGWSPRYPTYREGLAEVVAAWRADGFIPAERAAGHRARVARV